LRGGRSIYHAMPRLRCLSALKWIKCQIAIFGTAAIHANLLRLGTFPWQVSHIRQRAGNTRFRRDRTRRPQRNEGLFALLAERPDHAAVHRLRRRYEQS
jgi:hypothetical protein